MNGVYVRGHRRGQSVIRAYKRADRVSHRLFDSAKRREGRMSPKRMEQIKQTLYSLHRKKIVASSSHMTKIGRGHRRSVYKGGHKI
jgi:hypothetical protein